jgi:hypothetical protein
MSVSVAVVPTKYEAMLRRGKGTPTAMFRGRHRCYFIYDGGLNYRPTDNIGMRAFDGLEEAEAWIQEDAERPVTSLEFLRTLEPPAWFPRWLYRTWIETRYDRWVRREIARWQKGHELASRENLDAVVAVIDAHLAVLRRQRHRPCREVQTAIEVVGQSTTRTVEALSLTVNVRTCRKGLHQYDPTLRKQRGCPECRRAACLAWEARNKGLPYVAGVSKTCKRGHTYMPKTQRNMEGCPVCLRATSRAWTRRREEKTRFA